MRDAYEQPREPIGKSLRGALSHWAEIEVDSSDMDERAPTPVTIIDNA